MFVQGGAELVDFGAQKVAFFFDLGLRKALPDLRLQPGDLFLLCLHRVSHLIDHLAIERSDEVVEGEGLQKEIMSKKF